MRVGFPGQIQAVAADHSPVASVGTAGGVAGGPRLGHAIPRRYCEEIVIAEWLGWLLQDSVEKCSVENLGFVTRSR